MHNLHEIITITYCADVLKISSTDDNVYVDHSTSRCRNEMSMGSIQAGFHERKEMARSVPRMPATEEIPSAEAPFVVADGAPAEADLEAVPVWEAPVAVAPVGVGRLVYKAEDLYVTQLEDLGMLAVYGGVTGPMAGWE